MRSTRLIQRLTILGCVALVTLGTSTAIAFAQSDDGKESEDQSSSRTQLAPSSKEVFKQPSDPLDDRISKEKITESDPPPLPERVVLPMPPVHHIADDPAQVPIDEQSYHKAKQAIERGLEYLKSQQSDDGAWMKDVRIAPTNQPDKPSPVSVAVTALVAKAMIQADPDVRNTPRFQKILAYIRRAQNEDGSYEGGALTNYVTATVVMALSSVDRQEFVDEIEPALTWLKRNQWDQTEGLDAKKDWFGGAGYGNRGRPDMSNTQMMLDAFYDAGVSPDEPAMQKALAFVSRAQNLKKTNNTKWVGNDGGFIYTPANGGESMASEAAGEGRYGEHIPEGEPRSLRSYGSMTYAGFKSMLYAGLSPDDVRVRAAFEWLRRHWTFEKNPGLGQQGLYYYYHALARALLVAQQETITDTDGNEHNWREELIDAIVKRQREDGSWKNKADRWLEGRPVMATVYSVLALEETIKPVLIAP